MSLVPKRSRLLSAVVKAFSKISPLSLAENDWDNVGVLIECHEKWNIRPLDVTAAQKSTILLTIDLNHEIIDEALHHQSSGTHPVVIVAYHPTIFKPIKKLTLDSLEGGYSHINELVVRCIQSGLSVFSPHTALDNCHAGINDWICSLIGNGTFAPIIPNPSPQATVQGDIVGSGRYLTLAEPSPLEEIADRLMKGFATTYARIAKSAKYSCQQKPISKLAVCAGSGGSILLSPKLNSDTELLITGEMSHHDVLAATAKGYNVMLFEHTHTERGYLSQMLKPKLESALSEEVDIQIFVSKYDRDPIQLYKIKN